MHNVSCSVVHKVDDPIVTKDVQMFMKKFFVEDNSIVCYLVVISMRASFCFCLGLTPIPQTEKMCDFKSILYELS